MNDIVFPCSQRDVLDELRKIKDLDMLDMIPERDTSAKRVGGQLKPKGKVKVNGKVTAAPRSRVGSKAASRIAEKENVAQKKTQVCCLQENCDSL